MVESRQLNMKDKLTQEIEQKMNHYFDTVSDEQFIKDLEDADWEHYANLPDLEGFYENGRLLCLSGKNNV